MTAKTKTETEIKKQKEMCVPVIKRIVELAEKARAGGILALEENIEQEPNFFLKTGLYLLTDGVSDENIKEVMQALSKAYSFMSLTLQKSIITYGILMIMQGKNPQQIEQFLYAMPDEKLTEQIEKEMSEYPESIKANAPAAPFLTAEEIKAMMEEIKAMMNNQIDLKDFRNKIDEIDDKIIELLTQRFSVVKEVGEYKKLHGLEVLNQGREAEILNKITDKYILNIYAEILKSCREMQM